MDLAKLLEVLKEINAILATLQAMGLKITGTLQLADLLKLVKP